MLHLQCVLWENVVQRFVYQHGHTAKIDALATGRGDVKEFNCPVAVQRCVELGKPIVDKGGDDVAFQLNAQQQCQFAQCDADGSLNAFVVVPADDFDSVVQHNSMVLRTTPSVIFRKGICKNTKNNCKFVLEAQKFKYRFRK